MSDGSRRYETVVSVVGGRVMVFVPFDPDAVWGFKPQHHVAGTVNGRGVRAEIESLGDGVGIVLGAAWRRDCGVGPGDPVSVVVRPEGPQRDDLAPDPWLSTTAGHTSDGLTGPSAGPDVRAQRIAEMVGLLKLGIKERPPV